MCKVSTNIKQVFWKGRCGKCKMDTTIQYVMYNYFTLEDQWGMPDAAACEICGSEIWWDWENYDDGLIVIVNEVEL